MKIARLEDATSWFQVLATTKQSQTALMTLQPNGESSEAMNTHEKSDQVVFIVEGEITAEVAGTTSVLRSGDSCIIPAGTPHRLTNVSSKKAVTFNVYSPPEYPPGEKG